MFYVPTCQSGAGAGACWEKSVIRYCPVINLIKRVAREFLLVEINRRFDIPPPPGAYTHTRLCLRVFYFYCLRPPGFELPNSDPTHISVTRARELCEQIVIRFTFSTERTEFPGGIRGHVQPAVSFSETPHSDAVTKFRVSFCSFARFRTRFAWYFENKFT